MNELKNILAVIFLCSSMSLYAGVEMDMLTTDPDGAVTESVKVYAQSGKIRIEELGGASGQDMSMIFIGEEFIVVDHAKQSYIVLDQEMVETLGSKVNSAMQQVRAQLADMEPEDRAIIEEMMQGEFDDILDSAEDSVATRVEQIGAGLWQSGECKLYAIYSGSEKVQEICAAAFADVEGAAEAMDAFRNMAQFINSLAESMPGPLGESMAENPMGMMDQMDGFPVRTINYAGGEIETETTLSVIKGSDLDPGLFDIPGGYMRQDPFAAQ